MNEELKDLWIIPGLGLEEKELYDGEIEFFELEFGQGNHHELLQKFAEKHGIIANFCHSIKDFGILYTELGISFLINVGRINGKVAAAIYLPSQLSEKQIKCWEQKKKLLQEKFHQDISFFGINVKSDKELEYRNNGFRNLEIESIIEGKPSKNGQELLYREINRQKEQLKTEKSK